MIAFELINPSDEIWLKAPDARLAICAALLVGEGFYGLKDEHAETVMGAIAFGDAAAAFLEEKFGSPTGYSEFLASNLVAIADCLDSFDTKRERTSISDIVGNAQWIAGQLRKRAAEVETDEVRP